MSNHPQVSPRDFFRDASPLLPILQGAEIDMEALGEGGLAEPEALADGNDVTRTKPTRELSLGQRPRVRIRQCRGLDLFIRHFSEPFPVCSILGPGVTTGLVAYIFAFHGGLLS